MISACAVGQVVKGDKAAERALDLNEGTITDIFEVEGDDDSGADHHIEIKCPTPFSSSAYRKGNGRPGHGGCYASVGHLYAGGNTEERYRVEIYGVQKKGRRCDGNFDHSAGRGYVRRQVGTYDDALRRGARVSAFVVETTGAITPRSLGVCLYMTRRSRGKHARDDTLYGSSRTSARSFFIHHTQRISAAASCEDAAGIHESIRGRRRAFLTEGVRAGLLGGA
jgi:hypothetical protein